MKLLIIRPEPAACRSANAVKAAGMTADVMPLFAIAPTRWALPDDPHAFDALLITSANAVRHAEEKLSRLTHLPVLAVGAQAAQAARGAGFEIAITGEADKAALLAAAKRRGFGRLLWLAGRHRTAAAPDEALIAAREIVYESRELPVPPDFANRVGHADAALVYSPRAARYFAQMIDGSECRRSDMAIAALSTEIAEAAGAGWRGIAVANAPNEQALLLAAQSLATLHP